MAGRDNAAVLKPRAGVEYHQVEAPSPQAHQSATYLAWRYATGHEMCLGLAAVVADIDWDSSRTAEAEAALADLGRHLGFTAQMPERDFTIGSDVLWAVGGHQYWVIEAKTGATGPQDVEA